jgi:putative NIF3 family GTP cyclohydrolase 1 type 2
MDISRRDFLAAVTATAGTATFVSALPRQEPTFAGQMSIQGVIDLILRDLPTDPIPETVDTVKIGDTGQPVSGIAVTFLATSAVIEAAATQGANLIITHEPTFYNHLDETDWLKNNPVYDAKVSLIERHGVVVWRLHDHLHRAQQDDITHGVLRTLGWEEFASPEDNYLCNIPESSLTDLADFLKHRLGAQAVRMIGDPEMACTGIGVLMGAWGGRRQIEYLSRADVDVVICGEAREWETTEYARDANEHGMPKGLVVVGHALSEEPGMAWFSEWLRPRVPGVDVVHIPAGDPFRVV